MNKHTKILAKNDIVLVPFSNLQSSKVRPALVVATPHGDDIILAQITTKKSLYYSVKVDKDLLRSTEFQSYIKVNKLFTAQKDIIIKNIGQVNFVTALLVQQELKKIFSFSSQ